MTSIDTGELIDSTGGILLGEGARKYNSLINWLLTDLTERAKAGTLYADGTGENNDRERLRIALSEGELYYRRRGTMWARQVADDLHRVADHIDDLLNKALEADEDNNYLGREGLLNDELEAENLINEMERKINDARINGHTGGLRPGETYQQAMDEIHRLHKIAA